jgi:hypothetical protein
LGAEGFKHIKGFGFTPASKHKHFFTKSEVVKSPPPKAWPKSDAMRIADFRACPDFAIRGPLPLSLVGEVKYFKSGSPQAAVRELNDAARQVLFYLGSFQGTYRSGLVVVADVSPGHIFVNGLNLIRSELLARFGPETGIFLLPLKLN